MSERPRRGARGSDRAWLAALALAVASAQGAVIALRPRDGLLAAIPVDSGSFFEAEEVARARRYGRGQLALGAAGGVAETALMLWLQRRGRVRASGSLAGAAADGAALSVALVLVPLPFGALMRARALRVGLATQSWRGWSLDVARSGASARPR